MAPLMALENGHGNGNDDDNSYKDNNESQQQPQWQQRTCMCDTKQYENTRRRKRKFATDITKSVIGQPHLRGHTNIIIKYPSYATTSRVIILHNLERTGFNNFSELVRKRYKYHNYPSGWLVVRLLSPGWTYKHIYFKWVKYIPYLQERNKGNEVILVSNPLSVFLWNLESSSHTRGISIIGTEKLDI